MPFAIASFGRRSAPSTTLPTLPSAASIIYWFMADADAYSDAAGTVPCVNNDPVQVWKNQGTLGPAQQATLANRPIFKTGGDGGKPYIQATGTQFFNDLAITAIAGIPTTAPEWGGINNVAMVLRNDNTGDAKFRSILGDPDTAAGKTSIYYRPSSSNMRTFKSQWIQRTMTDNLTHILIFSHDYSTSARWSDETVLGTAYSDGTNASSVAVTATQFLRSTSLGVMNVPGDIAGWNGRLAELIIWKDVAQFSSANQGVVRTYLKGKYGL